ncbi:LLM class flavin-dependent oxidoreductase [Paenalkalicoccus suaedae]|uniref:LLM class flavin-dependent oxidoreductase n=1 Tax=Paenalkalicoccus suaedae TaxID=2592382 RepID=A0A859FDN2_9BACI|nr:LLM class flavin-dependent oxidoreductase [Paenalkalicoccus suaedae]QKS71197.1 LLM class flavin-dependent oxidoreductase [Paenalkalicoccus suaedae]
MTKQLRLNAFDMNSAMHNSHGLWKHPENKRQDSYKDISYWTDLAKLLEKGKFDAIFFADVVGVYDVYQQSKAPSIKQAMQVPINDPALLVSAMASVTKHLSFAVTVSTTYEHPFSNARRFSTLDHLTNGRVAWNIVTSYLPNAARNFGLEGLIKHDERYDIADDYLDTSYKLWETSWEDDAIVNDRQADVYIDPDKVHEINHEGPYFKVEGPHLSEPSLQRTPVLFQAGTSARGRDFAAKHAECIFVGGPTPAKVKELVADLKTRVEAHGRKREDVLIFSFLSVIVAESKVDAEQKLEEYNQHWSSLAAKAQFGASGYDIAEFEDKDPDDIFSYDKPTEGGHYKAATLTKDNAKALTVGEALKRFDGITNQVIVGDPDHVAAEIQTLFTESDVDGFNLNHFVTPSDLEDFVSLVVPKLQASGIYKQDYAEGTFRKKLFPHLGNKLPDTHRAKSFKHEQALS